MIFNLIPKIVSVQCKSGYHLGSITMLCFVSSLLVILIMTLMSAATRTESTSDVDCEELARVNGSYSFA